MGAAVTGAAEAVTGAEVAGALVIGAPVTGALVPTTGAVVTGAAVTGATVTGVEVPLIGAHPQGPENDTTVGQKTGSTNPRSPARAN